MSTLLEKAFEEIKKIAWDRTEYFCEMDFRGNKSKKKWDKLFAESEDILEKLAKEALEEHRAGKTKLLDFDKLWY